MSEARVVTCSKFFLPGPCLLQELTPAEPARGSRGFPFPTSAPPGLILCPQPLFCTRAQFWVCSGGCQFLEGFWLQQPVRKSCKSLFFWAQQGRLRTGRTFCGGLGTTGFGDSGSSMGLAASRASAPCPRFHFYPLVLGFLPSYHRWCLQHRLLRAQPPVGTSTCLLEVLGGCSPSRSVPFSGGKRGKSRSRVLRGSQSPVCGGSLHRHELFTPSAPLPDTSRLLPQPLTPRSAIQQRQRLQNL